MKHLTVGAINSSTMYFLGHMDGWCIWDEVCFEYIKKKLIVRKLLTNFISPWPIMPPTVSWDLPPLSGSYFKITFCTARQHVLMYRRDSARCLKPAQLPKTRRNNFPRKVICIMTPFARSTFFFIILSSDVMIEGSCVQVMFAFGPWSDCK